MAQRAKAFLDTYTPKAQRIDVRKLNPPAFLTSRGNTSCRLLSASWRVGSLSKTRRCAGITSISVATCSASSTDECSTE
jgi:hypothetical protein